MTQVRASLGTLAVLGLELVMMDAPPTTAYLQVYTPERCRANCLFCSQAQQSTGDLKYIARGQYIPADLDEVVRRLGIAFEKGYLKRACIQTAMYSNMWKDTCYLIRRIRNTSNIPISVSVFPLDDKKYNILRELDVEQLVIPLDAATPELFDKIKGAGAGGPFHWQTHIDGLIRAAGIFPYVGTHLIVGLGETDRDVIELVGMLHKRGIGTALFSYTRLPGTGNIEVNPDIGHYRRVQLATFLIRSGLADAGEMEFFSGRVWNFGVDGKTLQALIRQGDAFMTAGCSHCNRPYATESHDMVFNYPKKPDENEILKIKQQLGEDFGL